MRTLSKIVASASAAVSNAAGRFASRMSGDREYMLRNADAKYLFGDSIHDPVAGIPVTPRTALCHSAVYRCVSLIAASIASCTARVYRYGKDGVPEVVDDHPVSRIVGLSPDESSGLTPFMNTEDWLVKALLGGNAYSEMILNQRGQTTQAIPLANSWVHPRWDEKTGDKVYDVFVDGRYGPLGRQRRPDATLEWDRVFHLMNFSMDDGLTGLSQLRVMAEETSTGLAATRHTAKYFKKGRPLGFIQTDEWLKDNDKTKFQEEWEEMHRSPWSVGVLANKANWINLALNATDIQLIETRQFQVAEMARFFGVPGVLVGITDRQGYKSVEQLMRAFVTSTLSHWTGRIEGEMKMKFFTRDEQFKYFVRYDLSELQRGDMQAQAESLERELRHGALTVNEWRRERQRQPVPDGDEPLIMASQLAPLKDVISGKVGLGAKANQGTTKPKPKKSSTATNPQIHKSTNPNDTTSARRDELCVSLNDRLQTTIDLLKSVSV